MKTHDHLTLEMKFNELRKAMHDLQRDWDLNAMAATRPSSRKYYKFFSDALKDELRSVELRLDRMQAPVVL